MKKSDKKKIGEAYLRLHSDDKKKPMTPEEAIKELREASDSEVRYGDTEHHYDEVMKRVEALDLAIKALEQQQYIHDTCKKCVEFSEFKQQPCEDCISREEAKNLFLDGTEGYDCRGFTRMEIGEMLDDLPSVTPQQQSVTDFADKCKECGKILNDKLKTRWIPVSERLPEDFGTYLITLENGDVCSCRFNPDYIDEEHDKGAFTYYYDYFDNYKLELIDSKEIAVDAIAWMSFEPYTESEDAE